MGYCKEDLFKKPEPTPFVWIRNGILVRRFFKDPYPKQFFRIRNEIMRTENRGQSLPRMPKYVWKETTDPDPKLLIDWLMDNFRIRKYFMDPKWYIM